MNGAICDLLEHEPANKEVADKLLDGHCPDCGSDKLVRWCPCGGFHDLCTHYHCIGCDSDYCWPIAWTPPMPVTKMKGKLSPRDRRGIAKTCKENGIAIPDFWNPIMESDLEKKIEEVILICYVCNKEKKTEVITQKGEWHWGRGKKPRNWVDTDNEMEYSDAKKMNTIYAQCGECHNRALAKIGKQ